MNTLAFAIATCPAEDGTPYRALVITIDGVSLIEQVKHHEMPMATQENYPDIAGAYAWHPFSESLRSALRGVRGCSRSVARGCQRAEEQHRNRNLFV